MQQPHTHPVTCAICGGGGLGTIDTAAAGWDSRSQIVHSDPTVCRQVLDERAMQIGCMENVIAAANKIRDNDIDEEQHF